jgi:hypothetical protein
MAYALMHHCPGSCSREPAHKNYGGSMRYMHNIRNVKFELFGLLSCTQVVRGDTNHGLGKII